MSRCKKEALHSLRADIVVTCESKASNELPITAKGILTLKRVGISRPSIQIDWIFSKDTLKISGEKFTYYRSASRTWIDGTVNYSDLIHILTSFGRKEIRQMYRSIAYLGESKLQDGRRTWQLSLKPPDPSFTTRIDAWITADGMPVMIRIPQDFIRSTSILFSNIQENPKIDDSQFQSQTYNRRTTHATEGRFLSELTPQQMLEEFPVKIPSPKPRKAAMPPHRTQRRRHVGRVKKISSAS